MDPIQVVKSRYDDVKAVDNAMLFVIAKSSNKNTVVYSYNAESVVLPYWLMYEKTKKGVTPTETLTFLENQLAYGISILEVDSSSYEFKMAGYKKLLFQLRKSQSDSSGAPHLKCTVRIENDDFDIIGIFVHQSPGFFTTGVDGVSIVYENAEEVLQATYLANSET